MLEISFYILYVSVRKPVSTILSAPDNFDHRIKSKQLPKYYLEDFFEIPNSEQNSIGDQLSFMDGLILEDSAVSPKPDIDRDLPVQARKDKLENLWDLEKSQKGFESYVNGGLSTQAIKDDKESLPLSSIQSQQLFKPDDVLIYHCPLEAMQKQLENIQGSSTNSSSNFNLQIQPPAYSIASAWTLAPSQQMQSFPKMGVVDNHQTFYPKKDQWQYSGINSSNGLTPLNSKRMPEFYANEQQLPKSKYIRHRQSSTRSTFKQFEPFSDLSNVHFCEKKQDTMHFPNLTSRYRLASQSATMQVQPQQWLQSAISIPNQVHPPCRLPPSYSGGKIVYSSSTENHQFPLSVYEGMSSVPSAATSYQQTSPQTMIVGHCKSNRSKYARQRRTKANVGNKNKQTKIHRQSKQGPYSQADFGVLGFSQEQGKTSTCINPCSVIKGAIGNVTSNQSLAGSSRIQLCGQRPTEPGNSILRQMLSEPTRC